MKNKANWTYLVLLVFIMGFILSIVIFVNNNYGSHTMPWWQYAFFKLTQLIAVMVMFPGFQAWHERKQTLKEKEDE